MAALLALVVYLTTGLFPHVTQDTIHHVIVHPLDSVGGFGGGG